MNWKPAAVAALIMAAMEITGVAAAETRVTNAEEFNAAVGAVRPGDSIVLANGVYRDLELVLDVKGNDGAPVMLTAETPGRAILTGASTLRIGGEHAVVSGLRFEGGSLKGGAVVEFRGRDNTPARNCRLTETAIISYNAPWPAPDAPESEIVTYPWVAVYGENNRVDHCSFKDHWGRGVTVCLFPEAGQVAGHRIDNNLFADRPRAPEAFTDINWFRYRNGHEAIRIGTSGVSDTNARCIVEGNLFERMSGEVEVVSVKSCENVLRNNTFRDCDGALVLRHGHRNRVEGNFFLEMPGATSNSGGVRVVGEGQVVINNYFGGLTGTEFNAAISLMSGMSPQNYQAAGYEQVIGGLVAFNTIVGCTQPLNVGVRHPKIPARDYGERPYEGEHKDPPVDVMIANNVIDSPLWPAVVARVPLEGLKWQGNYFHGSEPQSYELFSEGPANVSDYTEVRPLKLPPQGVTWGEVGLRLGPDGLWWPAQGSAAIDGAEGDFPAIGHDILGRERKGAKDAGALELTEGTVLNRPLTAVDVGPRWMRPMQP